MSPLELLIDSDKESILNLLNYSIQGSSDFQITESTLNNLLQIWASQKQKLFNLMGQKLIRSYENCPNLLKSFDEKDIEEIISIIQEVLPIEVFRKLSYIDPSEVCSNQLMYPREIRGLKFQSRTKYSTVLKQLLKKCHINDKTIENLLIKYSQFRQKFLVDGTLCISIHPLDFLTMSINQNNWSSCCNLVLGDYRITCMELMTDSRSIISYSAQEKQVDFYQCCTWNNKKWRKIFYIDIDNKVFISSESYPFPLFSAEDRINQEIKNFFNSDFIWTDKKIEQNGLFNLERMDSYGIYDLVNLSFTGREEDIVFTLDSNAICPICNENILSIQDQIICDTCSYAKEQCMDCGLTLYQNSLGQQIDGISYQDGFLCEDCFNQYYDTCDSCYEIFLKSTMLDHQEKYLCSSCYNDYYDVCTYCQQIYLQEDLCNNICKGCKQENERI